MEKEINRSITLNAPLDKVWDALTKPEWTRRYMFGCDALSDWKPGSPLVWRGHEDGKVYVTGHIIKIEPKKCLCFTTFDPNSGMEDSPDNHTTVTYELSGNNGTTELRVRDGDFSKIKNGKERYERSTGGWEMTLKKLKEVLEGK
ncbi:MAG TPA: SRPBCC domain-containing protein [Bacteroidia bacterium]|jgi:uncharacterized protein YndB with AHSA1/START domain